MPSIKASLKVVLALGVVGNIALCAHFIEASALASGQDASSQPGKVMREYKGVKLGMKRDDARAAAGKVESSTDSSDEFKLTGDDTMTIHYDNGAVKAIQLAFLESKNAPAWKDVVGDAEVSETGAGAKFSRKTVPAENFWVTIYQSKDGTVTRITISR